MSKTNTTSEDSQNSSVDMDRIREMMGPLPDEGLAPPENKKDKKKSSKKKEGDPSLTTAAEEANEVLKAMSPDLGNATITKIDELPEGTEAGDIVEPTGPPPVESEPVEISPTPSTPPETSEEPEPPEGVDKDDAVSVKAVQDIVAHEGDEVLAAEDEKLETSETLKEPPKKGKLRNWLRGVWAKPGARWGIIGGIIFIVLAIILIPPSRYFILNNVGVRSSLSVKVIDNGTLQPLKNVEVSAAGVSALTDSEGVARLDHLKLGATTLIIEKRAFEEVRKPITVGWGSNPLGDFNLSAVGTQYSFVVTDYFSGKPIDKAEATSGEGNAIGDEEGKLVLTLDTAGKADDEPIEIHITAANYRSETVTIAAGNKEVQNVKMVTARKHAFVSKRSGNYDVYTIDADGKNEKKIVTGTGIERSDLALLPDKSGEYAAFVATRENVRNNDGYLLSTLYTINIKDGSLTKVDQSEQVQLIGWSDDGRISYVKIAAGASAANPKRNRLMSYSPSTGSTPKELYATNYFNDVLMIGNKIYYAPSADFQDPPKSGLFSVQPDGTAVTTIYDKPVWTIFRTSYDTLTLSAEGGWFGHKLGGTTVTPNSLAATYSRFYTDGPDGKTSAWIDERDGKGVLLNYDKATDKDATLLTKTGIKTPLYWLSPTLLVFRVSDSRETADFVMSVNGGDAKKITDVTDTKATERWFYY